MANVSVYFSLVWSIKISVNLLHIRLTRNLGKVHLCSKAFLVFLLATFVAVISITATQKRLPVLSQVRPGVKPGIKPGVKPLGVKPVTKTWSFWTPFALHLFTDVIREYHIVI